MKAVKNRDRDFFAGPKGFPAKSALSSVRSVGKPSPRSGKGIGAAGTVTNFQASANKGDKAMEQLDLPRVKRAASVAGKASPSRALKGPAGKASRAK